MEIKSVKHVGTYIFLVFLLFFLVFNGANLSVLNFNFDEGMYIYQSKLIGEFKIPYKDFFCHQPPLYPILLSLFTNNFSDALFNYRLLSLLSTAITGLLIYLISRRLFCEDIAAFSAVFFYFVPLQHYGKLALPNSMMVLFSSLSFYLLFIKNCKRDSILSGVCIAISILIKPIAISALFSFILVLILFKKDWRKSIVFLLAFFISITCIFLLMNIWSEGCLLKLIQAQIIRLTNFSGFEFSKGIRAFNKILSEHNINSAISWNIYSHKKVFLESSNNNLNFYFLLIALVGVPTVVSRLRRKCYFGIIPFLVWVGITFIFSIFVWTPSWDHYYLQYLPPLSIMATFSINEVYYKFKMNLKIYILLLVILLIYVFFGIAKTDINRDFYKRVKEIKMTYNDKLFTFNPLISFLTQAKPACGIIDPLNQYEPFGRIFIRDNNYFYSYLIRDSQIINCLESGQNIKIVIEEWLVFLSSKRLWEYIKNIDRKRLLYLYPCEYIDRLEKSLTQQIF
jgi:4-amino-4-deoxy-L-arabinose transferase-like glycosyltransferase